MTGPEKNITKSTQNPQNSKTSKTLQKDRKGEVVTLPRSLTYVNALLMNFLSAM